MSAAQKFPLNSLRMKIWYQVLQELIQANWCLFLSVALFIWGWMAVYVLTVHHSKYTSQSLVLIKDSAITTRYVIPDQNYAMQTTSSSASNPVLNTMGLLKSQAISQALWQYFQQKHPAELKKLGIQNKTQWESFYGEGKAFLKSKNEPGTDLISIQFSWTSPTIAKEALEVIVNTFQSTSLTINRAEQQSKSRYLKDQVNHIQTQLNAVRTRKSQYKSKMHTVNIGKESDALASTRIELATRLNQLEANARGKETEYLRYQKMLDLSPEKAITASALGLNATLARLQDELYQLTQTHSQLKATLTDKNPKLKEVKAQIEQVKQDINTEMRRTLGAAGSRANQTVVVADKTRGDIINQMVMARAESIRLYAEAQVIRERLDEIDAQIAAFPDIEEALAGIEEEERSLSAALNTLRQKALEAHMKEAEAISNVFIVDNPRLPLRAKFPNTMQMALLGFLLGIAGGFGAVFIKHHIHYFYPRQLLQLLGFQGDRPEDVIPITLKSNPHMTPPSAPEKSQERVDVKSRLYQELKKTDDPQISQAQRQHIASVAPRGLNERLYIGLMSSRDAKRRKILDYLVGPETNGNASS